MMEFIKSKSTVLVDAKTLMVEELRKIYESDRSTNKEAANKALAYIHIVAQVDPEAPFFNASVYEIEELARRNVYGKDHTFKDKQKMLLDKGVEIYKEAVQTPDNRIISSINKKIDQIQKKIDDTMIEIKEFHTNAGTVGFKSNFDIINKMIQNLEKIMETRDKLVARVQNQMASNTRARGNKNPSILEKKHAQS